MKIEFFIFKLCTFLVCFEKKIRISYISNFYVYIKKRIFHFSWKLFYVVEFDDESAEPTLDVF